MKSFSKAELQQVEQAVAIAEKKTTGEIVPLLCPQADHYTEGAYIFSSVCTLCFSFICLASPAWISVRHLVYGQVFTFFIGFTVTHFFPRIRVWFISKQYVAHCTKRLAMEYFQAHGITHTEKRTGILIALFLLERRVEVVADEAIHHKCPDGTWNKVVDIILKEACRGKIITGLCDGVTHCGKILAAHFPGKGKKTRNELSNRLRILP